LSAVQLTAPRSFFPPKHIDKIGTVQDAGLLENDPVLWALSEISVHYPHSEEPDFVVSLGTGEPGASNYDVPTSDCRGARGNGMLRRFCDLLMEKSRDKPVRRACKTVALAGSVLRRIHRLNVSFPAGEPRLDDVSSIPELIRTAQHDPSLTSEIDVVARRMIASLFYFELTLPPQWYDGKYVLSGRIRCSIPCGDVAFEALLSKVSSNGGRFFVNDWVIPGMHGRSSFLGKDGNFEVQVSVETTDRFATARTATTVITTSVDRPSRCRDLLLPRGWMRRLACQTTASARHRVERSPCRARDGGCECDGVALGTDRARLCAEAALVVWRTRSGTRCMTCSLMDIRVARIVRSFIGQLPGQHDVDATALLLCHDECAN
jgi:hypothetical protein